MTSYFRPNRSNRPSSSDDPFTYSHELHAAKEHGGVLIDGRPYVQETAIVEGFTLAYWYFDATGLETATVDGLKALLVRSGVQLAGSEPDTYFHARLDVDGQGRSIWEFEVTYCND